MDRHGSAIERIAVRRHCRTALEQPVRPSSAAAPGRGAFPGSRLFGWVAKPVTWLLLLGTSRSRAHDRSSSFRRTPCESANASCSPPRPSPRVTSATTRRWTGSPRREGHRDRSAGRSTFVSRSSPKIGSALGARHRESLFRETSTPVSRCSRLRPRPVPARRDRSGSDCPDNMRSAGSSPRSPSHRSCPTSSRERRRLRSAGDSRRSWNLRHGRCGCCGSALRSWWPPYVPASSPPPLHR